VRSFPVVERQTFVWIWMGDPALAEKSQIVDYPYHDEPDRWPHRKDVFVIDTNYMLMMDNLCDLTHLGYVHGKTVGGQPQTHVEAKMTVTPTERGVHFIRWMLDCEPAPTYKKAAGFKGKVDRWQEFEYVAPTSVLQWSGALDVGKGAVENRNQDGFHLRLYHGATPETETSFHYFWSSANGYRQDDPAATQEMYDEIYPTFIEDKVIMEAQQSRVNLNPDRELMHIKADGVLTIARQKIRQMIEAEQAIARQAAE
jgi:vanillate O-demethylase monooxygenase subunit